MLLVKLEQVKLFYKAILQYISRTLDIQTLSACTLIEIYSKEAVHYMEKDICPGMITALFVTKNEMSNRKNGYRICFIHIMEYSATLKNHVYK